MQGNQKAPSSKQAFNLFLGPFSTVHHLPCWNAPSNRECDPDVVQRCIRLNGSGIRQTFRELCKHRRITLAWHHHLVTKHQRLPNTICHAFVEFHNSIALFAIV